MQRVPGGITGCRRQKMPPPLPVKIDKVDWMDPTLNQKIALSKMFFFLQWFTLFLQFLGGREGAFCPPPYQIGFKTTVKARRIDGDHPNDGDDSEEGRLARRCQVVAPKPVFWTANVIERQKVTQSTITTNRREESALWTLHWLNIKFPFKFRDRLANATNKHS